MNTMENTILKPIEEKTKKKKHKGLRIAFDIFIYIAIVGTITFGIPKFLSWYLETSYPMATITSGSMWPVLKTDDLVFIKGVHSSDDIKIGDIVVYSNKETGTFVIHRVVAKGEKTVTTKGDANFTQDAPVPYENVIGKTYKIFGTNARIPYLGAITIYFSKKVNSKQ